MKHFRLLLTLSVLALAAALGTARAGVLYAIDDGGNNLLRVDAATGAITLVGSLGVSSGDFGDLSYNPADGKLYWAAGRDNNSLYTVDPTTGAATLIGSHGINDLFALAWDNGGLYGEASDGNFYSINPVTAAATLIGNNGLYPGGLVYNSAAGTLYLLTAGGPGFYSIDPATGAATLQVEAHYNDGGITYDPEHNSYWVDTWSGELLRTSTSFAPPVSYPTAPYGYLDGIAYFGTGSTVPEPGSLVLIGGGLGLAGLLRRRRA